MPYHISSGPPPDSRKPAPWRPPRAPEPHVHFEYRDGQHNSSRVNRKHFIGIGILAVFYLARVLLPPIPAPEPTPAESAQIGWYSAEETDQLARDVYDRLNDERVARGLKPLAWSGDLAALAHGWSARMIEVSYEHSPETYRTHPGFPWGMSENIAMGQETSDEVHVEWMRSEGHRLNILESSHGTVGVGIVCRKDGRMWATQLFAPDPAKVQRGSFGPAANSATEPIERKDEGIACPRSLAYKASLILR